VHLIAKIDSSREDKDMDQYFQVIFPLTSSRCTYVSLYNKVMSVLPEIMTTPVLVAVSTNSGGWLIYQYNPSISCHPFSEERLFRGASADLYFVLFSVLDVMITRNRVCGNYV
jgi:hypothetical protein